MIQYIPQRCQPWRHKKAECTLCLDACPVEACLKREDGRITADRSLCTDCGVCTTVCPSGALVLEWLDDRELLRRLVKVSEGRPLALVCGLGPGARDAQIRPGWQEGLSIAMLPCLAVLKESHLVHLVARNSLKISLDCSGCHGCSITGGMEIIKKNAAYAENLLSTLAIHDMIELLTDAPSRGAGGAGGAGRGTVLRRKGTKGRVREIAPAPEYSRRELFTFFGEKARAGVSERLLGKSSEAGDGFQSPQGDIPDRRAILLDALDALEGGPASSATLSDGEFPVRSISLSGCVICRRCDNFCPTGALRRVEREGETYIEFELNRCVSCRQCRELCPEGAISYDNVVGLGALCGRGPVTLASTPRAACPTCEKHYHPELDRNGCPTCLKRARLDSFITSILFGGGKEKARPKDSKEAV